MPVAAAGAIVAGLAAGSWVAGGALIVGFSWTAFAGSLILGGLSYALTPKPPKPAFDSQIENKGSTVAVRQSDLSRQFVYGHTRITRGYAHMQSTGKNGKLHIILILCEGPLRAINEVWLNDYAIPNDWIDSNGNVTQGRYAGKLVIRKHLGEDDQPADSLAVSNLAGWTNDHKLSGIAYLYLIMTNNQDVYPTGVPNVSAIVEGPSHYDPRVDDLAWNTNIAIYCHDFMRNERYGFAAEADEVDLTNVAAQANICDEIVDTSAIDTKILSVDTSTNIITLDGTLLQYQFGDRMKIVTSGTPPGGLNTTDSYYLIPYQVKDKPRVLLATSLENAMAKVAIDITSTGSGLIYLSKTGEPRYHGSGVVDSETPLSDTLNNLASCMAGRAVNVGGFWTLLAGAWRTPDTTYGIGDLRSAIGYKNALSMAESYNIVKGLFVSSLNLYQASDYPTASYPQFITDDNGVESTKELNLPYINRATTAQRIAKIELFRGRQGIVFNSDFSMKAIRNMPGDVVNLDIDRLGWSEKAFEITQFAFDVADGNLVTKLTLRETAQEIYDWSQGEAITYDPAPNTDLPNPFDVLVPTGVYYDSRVTSTRDGDAIYTMTLHWDTHPDAFVTEFGDFEIQYKLSDSPEYLPSWFVDGKLTLSDVVQSSVNIYYDLRIRARNNLGVRSGWVTIEGAVVGSSGGVGTTRDYNLVTDTVGTSIDYGSVADPINPGTSEDWEFVV